jgi:hypothetical protein
MKTRIIILCAAISCITLSSLHAQTSDVEAIKETITTMFDGMRAGDSAMVASAFVRDAPMHTVYTNQAGEVVRAEGSLDRFLNAVGTPHPEIWDEHIASFNIQIDGGLASVWTPYKFYLGERFSHCGVNSFQMAKLGGEWQIIYIVDTRRGTDCPE